MILGADALTVCADVIVLANRTGVPLPLKFLPVAGMAQQLTLPAGDVAPLFLDGRANVEFASPGGPKRYLLDANCAYYFGRTSSGQIDLQKIGLGEDPTTAKGRSLPGSASRAPLAMIPVKILVDEEEPARRVHWERRLQRRVEAASAILERTCRVGLRVVGFGTWNSDNATNDFIASLGEFERESKPSPARVAIGFTSQFTMVRGRTHMAGTRGPLHSHILVREGSPQISEPEKLEFLVHELGHHLGAAHSPERGSVMRPVLGDNQAGRSDFRIQFDPVNTLLISMIGEEIRRRNVKNLFDLTADSKRRLTQIYTQLAGSLPDDPAGHHYVRLLNSASTMPVAVAAKQVLQGIVRASIANSTLPAAADSGIKGPSRQVGDALTSYYVREAARTADGLTDDVAAKAFLIAIGVALNDSNLLSNIPNVGAIVGAVEAPSERVVRLAVLGKPTVHGRRDLSEHFFVSAFLTATLGADAAYTGGLAKELLDSKGGSGLSFADLAADRAGIRFADGVLNKRFSLGMVAQTFSVAAFVPEVKGLPESLSAAAIKTHYGDQSDPRFRVRLNEIDQRILALPAYRVMDFRIKQ